MLSKHILTAKSMTIKNLKIQMLARNSLKICVGLEISSTLNQMKLECICRNFILRNHETFHATAAKVRSRTMTQLIGWRSSWRSGKIGKKDVLGLSIFYATDFWALLNHNQGHSKPYVDFYVVFFLRPLV